MIPKEFNKKIRNKLIVTFLVPLLIIILISGVIIYFIAYRGLEEELSRKLISIGLAATTRFHADSIALLDPGDESTRLYRSTQQKLADLCKLTTINRIYLFKPDNTSLIDTENDIKIGYKYSHHEFDQNELSYALSEFQPISSILFQGQDGEYYKTGYIPIKTSSNGAIILAIQGNAAFYKTLSSLRRNMFFAIFVVILLIVTASLVYSQNIVSPIKNLVEAAMKISGGELTSEVNIKTKDEIGFLGQKFNQMRKNVLERDQRMQMMLRGIAHEVRNPLGGLELFCDLADKETDHRAVKRHLKKIREETATINRIVNEFLDFARTIGITVSKISSAEFLEEIGFHIAHDIEVDHILWSYTLTDKDIIFEADREHFKRVFLNVIKNALQSLDKPEKRMSVLVSRDILNNDTIPTDAVKFIIEDNGMGIKEDDIEEVFKPFFTTKEKGSGLGLAFVKKVINEHHGTIHIESKLKKGTKVVMVLPIEYKTQV